MSSDTIRRPIQSAGDRLADACLQLDHADRDGPRDGVERRTRGLEEVDSLLLEAHRLTHGDRNKDYGHPYDDYSRTAGLINAMLKHKLKEPILPSEAALIMCLVKVSRQINKPKRDNMVDLAGYAWVADQCVIMESMMKQLHFAVSEPEGLDNTPPQCPQRFNRGPSFPITNCCLNQGHLGECDFK